jgi:HemK-related putative methylase
MGLPTVSAPLPAPVVLDQTERMTAFASDLRRAGYDLAACAKRLGVYPRLGVNFWSEMRFKWSPGAEEALDQLITLLVDGGEVITDRLMTVIAPSSVEAAIEMGLLQKNGEKLTSTFCLFPCYGKYLVTDRAAKNVAINQVMWLWGESFVLGGLVKRIPRRRAIDLGTGSGIHAILASDHSDKVTAVDINPRAIAFTRFNAALNGKKNIEVVLSDLLESVEGTCDLLTANPPYAPDAAAKAGDNFWSGGPKGTDLLRRIIEALPTRLEPDGTAHIIALYPNPPGTTIKSHFDEWLGGHVADWDVLDHTWPVPGYEDYLSEQPFRGDKSAWRFGVVSLRRAPTRNGYWKEVAGKGLFFGKDGACTMVADHDAR